MSIQNGRSFGTCSRFEASLACPNSCDAKSEGFFATPNLDTRLPWQQIQVHTIQESLPLHNNVACQLNNEAGYQHFPLVLPLNELAQVPTFGQNTFPGDDDSFDFSEYIKFDEDDDIMDLPSTVSSQSDVDTETSEESVGSPDAPFTCPDCGKQFSRYRDYSRRHKKVHEGQKPSHECHLCEKTFGRMDSLQRHLQKKACPKLKGKDIRIVPTDPAVYNHRAY